MIKSKNTDIDVESIVHLVFSNYVDNVHLEGDYENAATLSEKYLKQYTQAHILNKKELLNLAIRNIHYKMFFLPVRNLINEALELEKKIDSEKYHYEYNEILFLLGGNLGVLSGDFELAYNWLEKSLDYAKKNNLINHELRTIRKLIDIADYVTSNKNKDNCCVKKLISNYLPNISHLETRYHAYLLGSVGEVSRCDLATTFAIICFDKLKEFAVKHKIQGWVGHASLGKALACLTDAKINTSGAESALTIAAFEQLNAVNIYHQINHNWGLINAAIVKCLIQLENKTKNQKQAFAELKPMLNLARELQYTYCVESIEKLLKNGQLENYKLLFL